MASGYDTTPRKIDNTFEWNEEEKRQQQRREMVVSLNTYT